MKTLITQTIKILAICLNLLGLIIFIFQLQYSILTGPLFDALLLVLIILLELIFSIILIPLNGFKKFVSYVPFTIICLTLFCFLLPVKNNISHKLHFALHKSNLNNIDLLSQQTNIYDLNDMLRYHKRINEKGVSNEINLTTKEEIKEAFGEYINSENLDIESIWLLRNKLEKSNIISLHRSGNYLILTIDGIIDNEYGYVKNLKDNIEVGMNIPPYEFTLVRLIKLQNGWYFFYTT